MKEPAFLLILCALLYLPGFFTIPAIDRDEARFAQASRQMAQAESWHGWIVPMVQERPRLQKPPLIYWLEATSARIFTDQFRGKGSDAVLSDRIWMYRLPSLFAAIATVLIVWRWAHSLFDRRAALLAGSLMAVNPLMFWEARQARADMLLLAFTALAMWSAFEVTKRIKHNAPRTGWIILFWCAIAGGIMTKGPITPMVVGLGLIAHAMVRGEWKWITAFKPVIGLPLALLPIGLWVWLVTKEIDLGLYLRTIHAETLGRGFAAMEGHGGPAGYHAIVMHVGFLPGCMVAGLAIWRAVQRGFAWPTPPAHSKWWTRFRTNLRNAKASALPECFLVCMLVPGWIVFEVSGTKLPHYTLPLYPILALLAARAVLQGPSLIGIQSRRAGRLLWIWAGGCAFLALFVGGLIALLPNDAPRIATILAAAVCLASIVTIILKAKLNIPLRNLIQLQLASLTIITATFIAFGSIAGSITPIRVSRNLASAISAAGSTTRPIAAVGWHEDSLIFETRGQSRRVDEWKLKEWLRQHDSPTNRALIVMERERFERWPPMRELAAVKGFNYSNGKQVDLVLAEMMR